MDIDQPAQTIAEFVLGIPEMHQLISEYVSINSIYASERDYLKRNCTNSNLYNFLGVCKRFNAISSFSIRDHLQYMNPYHIIRLLRAGKVIAVKYLTCVQRIRLGTWERAYADFIGFSDNINVNHIYVIKTGKLNNKYPTGLGGSGIEGPYFIRPKNILYDDYVQMLSTPHEFINYDISSFVDRFKTFIYESKIPSCERLSNILHTRNNYYSKFITESTSVYQDYYDNYLSRYHIMEMIVEFFEELDLVNNLL
jgi:hypothetical protein